VQGGQSAERLLFGRPDFLAQLRETLADIGVRQRFARTAAFSRATIAGGVPLGSQMPCQIDI
jgi:hypothetical protein